MSPRSASPAVLLGVRVTPTVLAEIDALAVRASTEGRKIRRSDVARAAIKAGLRVLLAEGLTVSATNSPSRSRIRRQRKARGLAM